LNKIIWANFTIYEASQRFIGERRKKNAPNRKDLRKQVRQSKKTQKAVNSARQALARKRPTEEDAPAPAAKRHHSEALPKPVSESKKSNTGKEAKPVKPSKPKNKVDAGTHNSSAKKPKESLNVDLFASSGSKEREVEDREIAWLEAQLGVRSKKGKGKATAYGSAFAEDGLEGKFPNLWYFKHFFILFLDIMMDLDKILMPQTSESDASDGQGSAVCFAHVLLGPLRI
jgi:hypothetical protein